MPAMRSGCVTRRSSWLSPFGSTSGLTFPPLLCLAEITNQFGRSSTSERHDRIWRLRHRPNQVSDGVRDPQRVDTKDEV